jgi:hypothetical protein
MLDWEPSDIDEPSAEDRGGVSAPELDVVMVDERERELGLGRVKTVTGRTESIVNAISHKEKKGCNILAMMSSPSAKSALSSKLCRTSKPCLALIILAARLGR